MALAATQAAAVTVEADLLRSMDGFEALAPEWSGFEAARQHPLLSHGWFAAAAESLHAGDRLCVIAIRRDGRLAAAAPLAEVVREGRLSLEFIGSHALYEPAGFLYADREALDRLCKAIIRLRRPVALLRLPATGRDVRSLAAAARWRGLRLAVASPPCVRVDLNAGWDAYLATRAPGAIAGIERKRRRLAAAGSVQFQMLAPDPGSALAALDEAVDVEADGWKGRAGSAMRLNPPILAFVRALATRFAAAGSLRIAFLRSGDTAIATCIMLEWNGRLWEIKKGYRESAGRYSPGAILLHDVLREACRRGLDGYEFLGSGDALQPAWGNGSRDLQSLLFYPYSLRGAWTLAADVAGRFLRRRAPAQRIGDGKGESS